MIAFILVPKNVSLQAARQKALQLLNTEKPTLMEVRGEDIPAWVFRLASLNKRAIGLTGEDLFREFLLKQYNSGLLALGKVVWEDPLALFEKPTLCLLGQKDKSLSDFPKRLRVGISSKYEELAKKYLNQLEKNGYVFQKLYINGCCEALVTAGLADLVIDIVYTGKSMKEAGLAVYDKIFSSDFVIIGSKRFWRRSEDDII